MKIDSGKKKIVFLFGAGAEGAGNYGMPTGIEYTKQVMRANEALQGYKESLKQYFKCGERSSYFNNTYSYRQDSLDGTEKIMRRLLIKMSCNKTCYVERHREILSVILSEDDISEINDYWRDDKSFTNLERTPDKKSKNEYIRLFNGLLNDDFKIDENNKDLKYKQIIELFNLQDDQDNEEEDKNTKYAIGTAGIMDGYFHTIVDPHKYGPVKFSKVFNYYWACYFVLIKKVLLFISKNPEPESIDIDKYLEISEKEKKLIYSKVLQDIQEVTQRIYEAKIPVDNTYYDLIREKLDENADDMECEGVLTTNYYKFCERVCCDKDKIAYLNGELRYFEYPELLEIYDFTDKNHSDQYTEKRLFFPFLFGTSYVKPIVDDIQIQAFSKMKHMLKETNVLVILGFNINEDDNHINSYLHNYIKEPDKQLIWISDKDDEVRMKDLCSKLRLYGSYEDRIKLISYNSTSGIKTNKEVVDEIFRYISQL